MASDRSGGVRLVSPSTRAGTRPRASAQTSSVAAALRCRTSSAASRTGPGPSMTRGTPSGRATATTSSPGSDAASRAASSTSSFHPSAPHVGAGPRRSTGVCTSVRTPRPTTVATWMRTTTNGPPREVLEVTGRGSAVSVPVSFTTACDRARSSIGPTVRIVRCAPHVSSSRAVSASVTATSRAGAPGARRGAPRPDAAPPEPGAAPPGRAIGRTAR